MEYIKKTALDTKKPVGNGIQAPQFKTGGTTIVPNGSADMTNSGTDINITASTANLSAKWKNGAQDVPEAGRGQYE